MEGQYGYSSVFAGRLRLKLAERISELSPESAVTCEALAMLSPLDGVKLRFKSTRVDVVR